MLGLFHFILPLVHSYGRILAREFFIFIFFLFFHLLNEYNINTTPVSYLSDSLLPSIRRDGSAAY